MEDVSELHLSLQERVQLIVCRLPVLTKSEIPAEDSCPICLNAFHAILDGNASEELRGDAPEFDELAGVTKLVGCGHVFCKACLVEWIRGLHGSCPSCRNVFSSIRPPSDSDNESSDGDYVPGDDEEDDEEDGFFDSDAFMDTESEFDPMDIEVYLEDDIPTITEGDGNITPWGAGASSASLENLGLSDGDGSDSVSEVEGLAMSRQLLEDDGAGIYSDAGDGLGGLCVPQDESAEPK